MHFNPDVKMPPETPLTPPEAPLTVPTEIKASQTNALSF